MLGCIEPKVDNCCGCTACFSVCPVNAIKMGIDEEGFYSPKVNSEKCIECGLCKKVCPTQNRYLPSVECKEKTDCAYAFQGNNELRKLSASGAFFPTLAEEFIVNKKGYVVGCILDENLIPKHIVSNNLKDIARMQDSKYVESDMGECILKVVKLLRENNWILFSGTSCQVDGLMRVLKVKKIDSSKLLTVDFFCHGTPSPTLWKEYLEFYKKEKKCKIQKFRFRRKKYLWGRKSRGSHGKAIVTYQKNTQLCKSKEDESSVVSSLWHTLFWSGLCLREFCYSCPYSTTYRPADITMGDFWGIEDIDNQFNDSLGCSIVIPHTDLGKNIIEQLNSSMIQKEELEKSIKKQHNAFAPSDRPKDEIRCQFWNDYNENDFDYIAFKYGHYSLKRRIKYFIRYILFRLHICSLN